MYGIIFSELSHEPKIGEIVQREHFGEMKDFVKYLDSYIMVYPELKIVNTYEEALKVKEDYEKIRKEFNNNYIEYNWVMEHYDELSKLKKDLDELVKKYENISGYDFCDVSANGVQVRLSHKEIPNYTYGEQITILYDCSNINEIVDLVEKMWIEADTPEKLEYYKKFIAEGEKYGWD